MEIDRQNILDIAAIVPGEISITRIEGPKLKNLFYSTGIPAILGMNTNEYEYLTRDDAMTVIFSSDKPVVQEKIRECLSSGHQVDFMCRMFHKHNGFIWVYGHTRNITDSSRDQLLISTFGNVSKETAYYDSLLDSTGMRIVIYDCETMELLYANASASSAVKVKNYAGYKCYEYIHGAAKPCINCQRHKLMAGAEEERHQECIDERWLEVSSKTVVWGERRAVAEIIIDSTDRHTAQKKLEDSNRELAEAVAEQQRISTLLAERNKLNQLAIEGARLAVWEFDISRRCIYLPKIGKTNYAVERYGNFDKVEGVPESLLKYACSDQDRQRYVNMYKAIFAGKAMVTDDFWYRMKTDDLPRCERVTYSIVCNDEGQPIKAYGVGQDITAYKLAEEKYKNYMNELLTITPQSLSAFRINLTQNCCLGGRSLAMEMFRLDYNTTAEDFIANSLKLVAVLDERRECSRRLSRTRLINDFNKGLTRVSYKFRRLAPGGRLRWTAVYFNMAMNPATNDVEAVVYSVDIDDKIRNDNIIKRVTNEEYDFIILIDTREHRFEFIDINEHAGETVPTHTVRYDEDIVYAMDRLAVPEEREYCLRNMDLGHIMRQLNVRPNFTFYFTMRGRHGSRQRKQMKYCYLDDTHRDILLIRTDVTSLYQQEQAQLQAVRQALSEASRASQAKSEFLSNISHDMRTPLNGIIGFTNLAFDAENMDDMRDYLHKIKISGNILLDLINDTLELSQIESGKLQINYEPVEGKALFEDVVVPIRAAADKKQIKFNVDIDAVYFDGIKVDSLSIRKILLNLLANAIKFTPAGGQIDFRVEYLDPPLAGRNCRIIVADSGIGISPDFLPKIFEPFSQAAASENGMIVGTGLGLAIVRRLLTMLGGQIFVKSHPGQGTVFTVLLSIQHLSNKPYKRQTCLDNLTRLQGRKMLVCEDNALNMEITRTILESQGMIVAGVVDGQQAVELFAASRHDEYAAILMDIRMPVMDGREAAKKIRSLPRKDAASIPIIAMSADAYAADVEKCLEAGMDSHIAKPIDCQLLFSELLRLCK